MSVSVYAAALVVVTLMPSDQGRTFPRIDLILHFAAWTVLAFLTAIAWAKSRPPIGAAALAALASVCFGALLEVLQLFTGRSAEALDLAADALGAALGATAAAIAAWSGRRIAQRRATEGRHSSEHT